MMAQNTVIGSDLTEALEFRSEHAPENEIYDNFTRPLKAEVAAHFMQMSLLTDVDAFDDEDEDFAEEYTPLDDYEGEEDEEQHYKEQEDDEQEADEAAFDDDAAGNAEGDSGWVVVDERSDVDFSSEEGQHEEAEEQDRDDDQGGEEEAEGSLELSFLPGRTGAMTTKEMRLVLIDEIYSEAQLRMLAEGCAMVDGIPPAGYACKSPTEQSRGIIRVHAYNWLLCRGTCGAVRRTLAASAAAASAPEGSKTKVGLQAALRVAFAKLLPKTLPPLPIPV
eukprot:COSAG02_NODE_6263_length_3695_cov_1.870412_1_plen_278_part_00